MNSATICSKGQVMESISMNREARPRISQSTIKKSVLVIMITVLGLILIKSAGHAQPAHGGIGDMIDGNIRAEIIG
jgi:hypothetical protein